MWHCKHQVSMAPIPALIHCYNCYCKIIYIHVTIFHKYYKCQ